MIEMIMLKGFVFSVLVWGGLAGCAAPSASDMAVVSGSDACRQWKQAVKDCDMLEGGVRVAGRKVASCALTVAPPKPAGCF